MFEYSREWYDREYHGNRMNLREASFLDLYERNFHYMLRHCGVFGHVNPPSRPGARWLEVGCHWGQFAYFVRMLYLSTYLDVLDFSYPAVRFVRHKNPVGSFCNVIQGSVDALPAGDESYLTVSAIDLLEHLPDPLYQRASDEFVRVLQPMGVLIVYLGWNTENQEEHIHTQDHQATHDTFVGRGLTFCGETEGYLFFQKQ